MKNHAIATICLALPLVMGCQIQDSTSPESAPTAKAISHKKVKAEPKKLPHPHAVLKSELDDDPLTTGVRMEILIPETTTEEKLRDTLLDLYQSARSRTISRYNQPPSGVRITAYTSKELADSGMGQWIGMISILPGDTEPTIKINEKQLEQLGKKPETIFGLSEKKRIDIYMDYVRAEDKASPYKGDEIAYESALHKNVKKLIKKYKITQVQLDKIIDEANEKDWPLPPIDPNLPI